MKNEQFPKGMITPFNQFSKGPLVKDVIKTYLSQINVPFVDGCCNLNYPEAAISTVRIFDGTLQFFNYYTKAWEVFAGAGSRFGIEDTTTPQSRNVDLANYSLQIVGSFTSGPNNYSTIYSQIGNSFSLAALNGSLTQGDFNIYTDRVSIQASDGTVDNTHIRSLTVNPDSVVIKTHGITDYNIPLVINGQVADSEGVMTIPTGGGSNTASNGLTLVGSDIQLGGTLTADTLVDTDTHGISFSTNNPSGPGVNISNSTGPGLSVLSAKSGVNISSFGFGYPVGVFLQQSALNVVNPILQLQVLTETAGDGIGASIDFNIQNTTFGSNTANQIISKWTTAAFSTRTSEFSITGVNSNISNVLLKISGGGVFTLVQGLQNFANDAAASGGGIPVNGLYRNGSVVQIRVV